jgi:ribosome-binding protein aMBF1 (putative translation factor)
MDCTLCSKTIPTARVDMGYTICTDCSTEEKVSCHTIYPHKTGGYIQVVSKEQSENLNRLDRRGYKGFSTAKNYKSIIKKKSKDSDKTAEVRRYRTSSSDNIVHTPYDTALKQVLDYYDEWGYQPTLKYIRRMNSSGDIPLSTRVKIQDIITDKYLEPSPRALFRKFNKNIA